MDHPTGVVAAASTTQDLDDNSELMMQVRNYVWRCSFGYITSMSLKCAVELSIPDVIHKHGKPMTLSSLVEALALPKTKTRFLNNLMSFLVHSNFFRLQKLNQEEELEGFCLTPFSKCLVKENNPNNLSSVVLSMVDPAMVTQFQFLSDWFRGATSNGGQQKTAFEAAHGMNFWNYTEKNPKLGKTFDDAMASYCSSHMNELIVAMGKEPFKKLKTLVDVGGGIGIFIQTLSQALPHLKCSVFDLPNVVANHLPDTNHLEFIGGDMFESIPRADAILLKSVLHNWSDEDCVKILKKCKEAIPSREKGGKLIIIDIVIEKDKKQVNEPIDIQQINLLMMAMFASNERTEKQWSELFVRSGFTKYKITPLPEHDSLIEVYP